MWRVKNIEKNIELLKVAGGNPYGGKFSVGRNSPGGSSPWEEILRKEFSMGKNFPGRSSPGENSPEGNSPGWNSPGWISPGWKSPWGNHPQTWRDTTKWKGASSQPNGRSVVRLTWGNLALAGLFSSPRRQESGVQLHLVCLKVKKLYFF